MPEVLKPNGTFCALKSFFESFAIVPQCCEIEHIGVSKKKEFPCGGYYLICGRYLKYPKEELISSVKDRYFRVFYAPKPIKNASNERFWGWAAANVPFAAATFLFKSFSGVAAITYTRRYSDKSTVTSQFRKPSEAEAIICSRIYFPISAIQKQAAHFAPPEFRSGL